MDELHTTNLQAADEIAARIKTRIDGHREELTALAIRIVGSQAACVGELTRAEQTLIGWAAAYTTILDLNHTMRDLLAMRRAAPLN